MNHDELLEQIQKDINEKAFIMEEYYPVKMLFALRAVAELHKPGEYEFNGQPVLVCNHCQLGVVGDEYPCETIQAIEKELN